MSTPRVSSLTPETVGLVLFMAIIARRTVRRVPEASYSVGRWFDVTGVYVLSFAARLGLMVGRGAGVVRARRHLPVERSAGPPSPPRPSG